MEEGKPDIYSLYDVRNGQIWLEQAFFGTSDYLESDTGTIFFVFSMKDLSKKARFNSNVNLKS